jgi:hypothetical protein
MEDAQMRRTAEERAKAAALQDAVARGNLSPAPPNGADRPASGPSGDGGRTPRHYARWEDAMVAQARLREFTESQLGVAYLGAFQENLNAQHPPRARLPEGFLRECQLTMLSEAEPIYVSHQMTELVDRAREDWRLERVHPSHPWCPSGFALLARPIDLHDQADGMRDGIMPVRAIGWLSVHNEDWTQGAFWISYYNHLEDELDWQSMSEQDCQTLMRMHGPLVLGHTFQQTWGQDPIEGAQAIRVESEDPRDTERRATEQGQLIQTLWRLGSQYVPVRRQAPRGIHRDFSRRMDRIVDNIQVVVLRRAHAYSDEHLGDGVPLKNTILVHGYWAHRWKRLDPHPAPLVRVQVRVKAHLKGEGPMKDNERVWELRR